MGSRGQTEKSLKIEDVISNKTTVNKNLQNLDLEHNKYILYNEMVAFLVTI